MPVFLGAGFEAAVAGGRDLQLGGAALSCFPSEPTSVLERELPQSLHDCCCGSSHCRVHAGQLRTAASTVEVQIGHTATPSSHMNVHAGHAGMRLVRSSLREESTPSVSVVASTAEAGKVVALAKVERGL